MTALVVVIGIAVAIGVAVACVSVYASKNEPPTGEHAVFNSVFDAQYANTGAREPPADSTYNTLQRASGGNAVVHEPVAEAEYAYGVVASNTYDEAGYEIAAGASVAEGTYEEFC